MKETWVLYVYTILTMITALAISAIDSKLLWLQLILFALNIGLYGMVAYMLVFKTGEEAAKLRHANDIKRGAIIGLYASAPLLIMLLVQVILDIAGSDSAVVSGIIGFTYGAFFLPIRCIDVNASVYWMLYAVVIIVVITHIAYNMGARKVHKQEEKIKRTNAMIYGNNNTGKSVIGQKPIEEVVRENAKYNKRVKKKGKKK